MTRRRRNVRHTDQGWYVEDLISPVLVRLHNDDRWLFVLTVALSVDPATVADRTGLTVDAVQRGATRASLAMGRLDPDLRLDGTGLAVSEAVRAISVVWEQSGWPTCRVCHAATRFNGRTGRRREYCSDACRQKHARDKQKAAAERITELARAFRRSGSWVVEWWANAEAYAAAFRNVPRVPAAQAAMIAEVWTDAARSAAASPHLRHETTAGRIVAETLHWAGDRLPPDAPLAVTDAVAVELRALRLALSQQGSDSRAGNDVDLLAAYDYLACPQQAPEQLLPDAPTE